MHFRPASLMHDFQTPIGPPSEACRTQTPSRSPAETWRTLRQLLTMRPARLYSVGETVCRKRGLPLEMTSSSELPSSADSLSPDEEVELDRRFARSPPCSSFLALFFSRFASFLSSPPFSRCLLVVPPLFFFASSLSSLRTLSYARCSSAVGCSRR